jgi:hypothetical protein
MKVVALKKGFFDGQIQREGAEFAIDDKSQLGSWMRVIEEPKQEKPKPKKFKVKKEEVLVNQD